MSAADSGEGRAGPPVSKTTYVHERLREDINSGGIMPGEPLRQADLAARYGVSPTPVREALRLLEAEGTISYSPHRGATVAELSPPDIHDLYVLRAHIESLATKLAVERIGDQSLDEMLSLHRTLVEVKGKADGRELARLNRELHFAVYRIGSSLIMSHITSLWRLFPPQVTIWQDAKIAHALVRQHALIVDAIVDRDAELAAKLMSEHILAAGTFRAERDR